jgi:hypothetical protein
MPSNAGFASPAFYHWISIALFGYVWLSLLLIVVRTNVAWYS